MNNNQYGYNMLSKRHLFTKSSAGINKFHCPNCNRNDFEVKPSDGTYKCFSTGCSSADIRAAIDKLEGKPEWKPESKSVERPIKAIRKRSRIDYFYLDRDGNDLIRVRRDDDGDGKKKFTQAHWTGSAWDFSNPLEIRFQIPIYRYADVQQAIADEKLVFIVEGESAADALWDIGIPATTTIGGSSGFGNFGSYGDDFNGGKFALAPDCDKGGIKYMAEFAMFLGDKVHGYYLAGSNPDLWVDPAGGFDIKDDITDRHLDRDRILAGVIGADEYRKALNPVPAKPVGRPRKSDDELVAEKKEKTPARDLAPVIVASVYCGAMRYHAEFDQYWDYKSGLWSQCTHAHVFTIIQKYLIEIEEPYTARLVEEVVKLARGFVLIPEWIELDSTAFIPFKNGVLNVASGELLPHSPEYGFRWQMPRDYSPISTGWNNIDRFLNEFSSQNFELRNILLAFCNATLMGRSTLHKFLYLSGSGGNGKGVFMRLLTALVGHENTYSTSIANLNDNRFEAANIKGKRLVLCPDEDKRPTGLGVFKSATGGDNISCEFKGKQAVNFTYGGMFVVAANSATFIGDSNEAIKRRKVDFPCRHRPAVKNDELDSLLEVDMPSFTTYVLSLDADWVAKTIKSAGDVAAVKKLAEEMSIIESSVAAYYDERLVIDPNSSIPSMAMYKDYQSYCDDSGLKPKSIKNLIKDLLELCNDTMGHSIETGRTKMYRFVKGVRFATALDEFESDEKKVTGDGTFGEGDGKGDGTEPMPSMSGDGSDGTFTKNQPIGDKLNSNVNEDENNINYINVGSRIGDFTVTASPTNPNSTLGNGSSWVTGKVTKQHPSPDVLGIGDRVWVAEYNENGTVDRVLRNDPPKPHWARVILDSGKPCLVDILPDQYKLIMEAKQ